MNFLVGETLMFEVEADNAKTAIEMVKRGGLTGAKSYSCIENRQAAIQKDQWPIWAKAMKQFAKPEDKGIGDVVARMIGDENSEAFKAWYLATFGKTCGCTGRHARWNAQYPLNETAR